MSQTSVSQSTHTDLKSQCPSSQRSLLKWVPQPCASRGSQFLAFYHSQIPLGELMVTTLQFLGLGNQIYGYHQTSRLSSFFALGVGQVDSLGTRRKGWELCGDSWVTTWDRGGSPWWNSELLLGWVQQGACGTATTGWRWPPAAFHAVSGLHEE